jgi:hypothetical protein
MTMKGKICINVETDEVGYLMVFSNSLKTYFESGAMMLANPQNIMTLKSIELSSTEDVK